MSIEALEEIAAKISQDIKKMEEITTDQVQKLLNVMDDLAANILATQAVISSISQKEQPDMDLVNEWIEKNMDGDGEGLEKTKALAQYLATGE